MTHYILKDAQAKIKEEIEGLSEEEIEDLKKVSLNFLDYVVEEKLTSINMDGCVDLDDPDGDPIEISLRNKNGLSTKIMGDRLFLGTNGDWVEITLPYNYFGIDWKKEFEL